MRHVPSTLLLLLAPCLAQEPSAIRTNVVLILVDDLGWMDLGCQGSDLYRTPNIDRLAEGGLRFTQAYAAAAICSPTRAAVLTGRHPARVGITDWIRARFQGGALPVDGKNPSGYLEPQDKPLAVPRNPLWLEREERTLAEELQAAGYATCHVGKWHLGMDAHYPEHQGFDENHGGCDFGQPPSYFDPYANERLGGIPTLAPRREGEYLTDREADECVDFVKRHRDGPFFLYWAPYAVHTPIQAREDLTARYRGSAQDERRAKYAAMVESVDDGVGLLLKTLDELELTGRTLVVFTSDNGGLLGPTDNSPLRLGKGHPYEGGIRVPMIVRAPGSVPAAAQSDLPVTSCDLLPTVLEACLVPRRGAATLDGISLWRHCTTGEEPGPRRLVWHFPHYRSKVIPPYSILRDGNQKLLLWWESDRVELYDLGDDLGETRDLAGQRPEEAAALRERLMSELEALDAKLPRRR
ncbi:MAG: sulfatase [Planctomycetota bacterium]|nr:sulfatase [Planctomycetota bacterium]